MVDTDHALECVLERLSPAADARTAQPDWTAVRDALAAGQPGPNRRRRRFVLAGALAVVAIFVPTIAVSASVRGWLGLGTKPVYAKARLEVSTSLAGNRVARLWAGPSTDGGACEILTVTPASFVAIDPKTGAMRPVAARTRNSGGYECTLGGTHVPSHALTWTFVPVPVKGSRGSLLDGHVGRENAKRVDVVWNGGRTRLRFGAGYFIGVIDSIRNPAFRRLPFTFVAYDARGHVVDRSRIPTSFLYTDWKSVERSLHKYRQAHGCSTAPSRLWVCKSR